MNRLRPTTSHQLLVSLLLCAASAAALLFLACPGQKGEIKVGVILPLTGRAASYGAWSKEGMDLAAQEVNSRRSRYSLRLIVEDDGGSPERATSAFLKLVKQDRVDVVVGVPMSQTALAVAPIAEQNGVVLVSTGASSEKLRDAGRFVFRIREPATMHGKAAAEFALARDSLAGVIYLNAENGLSYAEAFRRFYERGGGRILQWDAYNEGETDFRSILSKTRRLALRTVYTPGLAPDIAQVLKQARELGLNATFISSVGAENPKLIEVAGAAANGLVYTYPQFDSSMRKDSRIGSFIERYKSMYHRTPEFLAANAYDAVLLVDSLIRAGNRSAAQLRDALYAVREYRGVGGTFSIDTTGEVEKGVILKRIENGQFVLLRAVP